MSTTALQKPNDQKRDVLAYFQSDKVKGQMALVLPKYLTPDRMARVVCTAIIRTPKLMQCRIESLLEATMILAQIGLEPDGRKAHLIPYGDKATAIVDYKGYVERAKANGVKGIQFDVVCMNDKFTPLKRTEAGVKFEHEIDFKNPDRGAMFAAYCCWIENGEFQVEIMGKTEIDAIRARSKASGSGPWVTDYNEMAKKTVVRRAAKKWPLDTKLQSLIDDGKIKSAEAVDVDSIIIPETPLDESNAELNPAKPEAAAVNVLHAVKKKILEANVPLDLFVADITARNIAQGADSWPDFDAVPNEVWDVLAGQPKTVDNMVKKFGKK